MKRNTELLEQTMQYIDDHPERHNQTTWMCGTAACFAGHAVLLSGYSVRYESRTRYASVAKDGGAYRAVMQAAIDELGLTEDEANILFGAYNTRPQLRLMVKDLVNGDDLRSYPNYEREAQA